MRIRTVPCFQTMAALGLLMLVGVHGTTIISIKYPQTLMQQQKAGGDVGLEHPQPAKRDLSLSYAATNIDSKEGTRVKTITVIKNVGGVGGEVQRQQQKLAIDPSLHQNEDWASAFRDNFDSYGALPDVPDIDDLFEFVNRKKPDEAPKKALEAEPKPKPKPKPVEETTTRKAVSEQSESSGSSSSSGSGSASTSNSDSDEAVVEKIKGDAELLPHIKQANILRLQAAQARASMESRLKTRESLIAVNYSTPMHQVTQYFDNYVQGVPNGYDYSKPCGPPPGGISYQVTTPSGRTYDIPQSNSSGTGGGNHPYLAPSLTKKTQIPPQAPAQPQQPQGQQPQPQQPPNYSSVNSIVPPVGNPPPQPQTQPPFQQQPQPQPQQPSGGILPPLPAVGNGISTSQRPYVAPRLRNNGLGISRGPVSPLPPLGSPPQQAPSFRSGIFGGGGGPNRPNTLRSRGLKY
ncbi:serine/threonine-protein kinase pakB [Drosophila persimilis]|uniref:serine/threonine-protein kinase pakB n=1 Tax=Drosophila persimilis TaxID=7234 RepID=UPI000F087E54|nr:serine/threonine-protein kinase pakB [Drosophila persimilis]